VCLPAIKGVNTGFRAFAKENLVITAAIMERAAAMATLSQATAVGTGAGLAGANGLPLIIPVAGNKRSPEAQAFYEKAKEELGNPFSEMLCENVTEEEAYAIEAKLIAAGREHYGYSFVINITSGLEQAADIGDMPINTILKLQQHRSFNLEEPRFLARVNLFQRYSEKIGSAKEYHKNITILNAAKIAQCSMNEVIAAIYSTERTIGNYKIVSNDELQNELIKP
jgi:hypothetical protein